MNSDDTMSEDSEEFEIGTEDPALEVEHSPLPSHVALNDPLKIVTFPPQQMVSVETTTNVYSLSKNKKSEEKRLRKEWAPNEDKIFLEGRFSLTSYISYLTMVHHLGLKKYKIDFAEIQKLLPHRSRSQIRTHYRYLARSIQENHDSTSQGGKKIQKKL